MNYTDQQKKDEQALPPPWTHSRFEKILSVACKNKYKDEIFKHVHGNSSGERPAAALVIPRKA